MNRVIFLVLWGLFLSLAWSCQSTPSPALSLSDSHWADRTLHATGIGSLEGQAAVARLQGLQEAKQSATHQLVDQILALQTDRGESLLKKAKKNRLFMEKIAAYAKNAEIVSTRMEEARILVEMRLVLGDDFKAVLGLMPLKSQQPVQPSPGGF